MATSFSCRNVRQESDLWDDLHAGVLTTSCLNGALGFYEPAAARQLHLPRGYASHNAAMSAYHRLRLPIYTPPFAERGQGVQEGGAVGEQPGKPSGTRKRRHRSSKSKAKVALAAHALFVNLSLNVK